MPLRIVPMAVHMDRREFFVEDHREDITPAYEVEQPEPKPKREINTRKSLRIKARGMKACIRQTGHEEDVVDVMDYSRGGLRFASFQIYEPDTWVEIATDYAPTNVNIFQRARIVGMYQRPWSTFPGEYGAQFMK